jgi:ABC-type sugar transport system ATPase subunit
VAVTSKSLYREVGCRQPRTYRVRRANKGIDVGARATIYDIIFDMAKGGKTIVVVSSEAEEILLLTHRVLVMREGKVVAALDSANATTEDLARAALGSAA